MPTINSDGTTTSIVSANVAAGFSIVKYIGTGSTATIGHGLGGAPGLILVKKFTGTSDWPVYSSGLTSAAYRLVLNDATTETTTNDEWNSTSPTSDVFSVGNGGNVSDNNQAFIAYCVASKDSYQRISTYSGDGNAPHRIYVTDDGQSTGAGGFQPSYVLIKRINSGGSGSDHWVAFTAGVVDSSGYLQMLRLDTQQTAFNGLRVTFNSDGFTLEDNDASRNASGGQYLYLAIK